MARVQKWFHEALPGFRMSFTINMNDPRNFGRYKSIERMKIEQEMHLRHFKVRVHPHSRFRVLWEMFYCGYIVINIMSSFTLLSLARLAPVTQLKALIMIQIVGDSILVLNIMLNFNTGIFCDDIDEAIMLFSVIWRSYMNSLFFYDLTGLVFGSPILFYLPWEGPFFYDVDLMHVVRAVAIFTRVISGWHYWENSVTQYFLIDRLTSSFVKLILFLPVPIFFLACLAFSAMIDLYYHYVELDNLMKVINEYIHVVIGVWLSRSIISNMSHPVFAVTNVIFVVYPYIKYFIIATFLVLIFWSRRGSANRYNSMVKNLTQYLQQVKISERLKIRISKYYEEMFQFSYYSESYILENVSSELREEILSFKLSKIREEIAILKMLPLNELILICKYLVLEVYFGNDVIAYSGIIQDRMYFLARGSVAVYTDSACEIYHIANPMHFLAGGILLNKPLTKMNFLACETTVMYSLSRSDFIKIMDECPVFTELLYFGFSILADTITFIEEKDKEVEESKQ